MTTTGYGISGIGLSPLGTMGLGMSGQYGSYDAYMPYMAGMGYGMGMMNPTFGMGGMMGMYPQFMAQMQQAQNQIEASQAHHSSAMHQILLNNEVAAHRETDSALVSKMITNGDIQQGVTNLYAKVKEGDQNGICHEFDKLKNYILTTYRDEFAARADKINPSVSATQCIEAVYQSVITAVNHGQVHDLRSDIKNYGGSSFERGFMQAFKPGHDTRYVDETLNHCFDLDINQKDYQDTNQKLGEYIGSAARVVKNGVYGFGIGAAGWGAANLGAKGLACLVGKKVPFKWRGAGWLGAIGAVAGLTADLWWKHSNAA